MLVLIYISGVIPVNEIILKDGKVYEYCYDADKESSYQWSFFI